MEFVGIAFAGVIYLAIIAFVIYLVFRVVRAIEKMADSAERIANKYESQV